MARVRMPAVAGKFYPAHADELGRLVDELVSAVEVPAGESGAAGYVVPHAGYRYSGPTAAHVYARLRANPAGRVLLLGPAHYSPVRRCAVPLARLWRTPLGDVPIDVDTAYRLLAEGYVAADDEPFEREHSLEVQLPFLQACLPPEVPVLPVVVGPSTMEDVAGVVAAVAGPDVVVLCSTDLSHYQTADVARRQDGRTAQAVLDLAPQRVGVRDACGVFALRGVIGWARQVGLKPRLLHLSTSADSTGDTSRVVGYGAFAFTAPDQR